MIKNRKFLNWEVGYCETEDSLPCEWVNAEVPGAVQLDWAKAKNYSDYHFSDNYKNFAWMEDKYWIYRTKFNIDEIERDNKCYFVSMGIDYEFEIFLNDHKLHYQEGMYSCVEIDLTDRLNESNDLYIKIWPVPKTHVDPVDHNQVAQSCKPAASYGWDWHPRLIPLGIWDETFLEIRNNSHISDLNSIYNISDELNSVNYNILLSTVNSIGFDYSVKLTSPSGKEIISRGKVKYDVEEINVNIDDPELWYPIGYGDQNLYSLEIELQNEEKKIDYVQKRIGFRRVKLVMNEGAWDEPEGFPKTRSVPPIQLEINGIKIFCKGSNWVMPEIFYGTITDYRYQELIDLAIGCNFNILRMWGGAIVNKEAFFDYCDERGLLVWQEFPLACTNYYDSEKYLATLENEATEIILKVSQHPSLALWCGGNELFNNWSRMTDQSLALRLLNKLCYEYDPQTPFIPTSPIMGVGHGHYLFHDFKNDLNVFDLLDEKRFTALTEYGLGGASSIDTISNIIPDKELWPPRKDTAWQDHHAFGAWDGDENSWLNLNVIEKYFGTQSSLEGMIDNSQTLQSVGLKYIFEEARRMQPYCSMALNWCFNDCWPTAANTSIVEYPNKPKKAYYGIKDALRPVVASARIKKFMWQSYEEFEFDLFLLNDSLDTIEAGKIIVSLEINNECTKVFEWNYETAEKQKNILGPSIQFKLPQLKAKRFYLLLEDEKNSSINSKYLMISDL